METGKEGTVAATVGFDGGGHGSVGNFSSVSPQTP